MRNHEHEPVKRFYLWIIFYYLFRVLEKREGRKHVCITRIFEIEKERRMERLLFQRLEKGREWGDIDAGEGRKLARRSSKRASLVVSWDIFNTPVSVIHRIGCFFSVGEVEREREFLSYLRCTKEFFISRVYIYTCIYVLVTRCALLIHQVKFQIKEFVPVCSPISEWRFFNSVESYRLYNRYAGSMRIRKCARWCHGHKWVPRSS